jgi:hypothetical protein
MGVVFSCALSFMSKYLHQSCSPKLMTRVDINDKNQYSNMKTLLRDEERPIRQRPYRLNLTYKKKVKNEIDRMLEVGIIEPVHEFEWISSMVVQEKKQGGIRIYVDLRKLNDACLYDPFPTTFTDEVFENVGGQKSYSFTDGFSRYHKIKIAPEDRYKTTFT